MVIYKITNTINNKFYIGKTSKTAEIRWAGHKRDCKYSDTKFYRALKKYGPDVFVVEVLEEVETLEALDEREIFWISSMQPEYNTAPGGTGGLIGSGQLGRRWKVKDTSNMKCKKTITEKVLAARERALKGGANYQSKYYIYTPWGIFETWKEASEKARELKDDGEKNVIVGEESIKSYCLSDKLLNSEGKRIPKDWRGKSTRSLGFYVVLKEQSHEVEGQ